MPATELVLNTQQPLLWSDLPQFARTQTSSQRTAELKQRDHRADYAMLAALAAPERTLFLDIETTGLSRHYDRLTLVGYALKGRYCVYIEGDSADELMDTLAGASTLVTFNGTLFDIPFLKRRFGNLPLPPRHVDLRYAAKRASLTGGQKVIEQHLGIDVRFGVDGIDGVQAVLLWHRYLRGDGEALRKLISYNRADVLGMLQITDCLVDRLRTGDLLVTPHRFGERVYSAMGCAAPHAKLPVADRLGKKRPSFLSLFGNTPSMEATIVGIDLTGSEAKPSGFSTLRGSFACTRMIGPDDAIIAAVLEAAPALVSIDSPLSLPRGRIVVTDDDPGRLEFGIMRTCERTLKRRGINVYPCLIPSMQKLTARGIRLACRLRSLGIPVIESYPGAAQDILGIPRKGAGEEWLKIGLSDFGIEGPFTAAPVKHDELDAITSALVGSFFLAGLYEGLGDPGEPPLIVPDIDAPPRDEIVVGVSGRIAAGKTTAAWALERCGYMYARFSLVIDEEIRARGLAPTRALRQQVGLEIHLTKGQRWLCERVLERLPSGRAAVVDGLRWPEDAAYLRERYGARFMHVHIKADSGLRAERHCRQEAGGLTFQEVDAQPVEAGIEHLAALADVAILNDGTIEELERNLLTALHMRFAPGGERCQQASS